MKILLNGLSVVYPISGVGQYTLQLGKALETLLDPGKIVWFGKDLSASGYESFDHATTVLVHRMGNKLKEHLRRIPNLNIWVHHWRNHRFASFVRKIKPSLYHETRYTPFDFDKGPTVITIYDLSFVRHPEWHPKDRVKHFEKFCLQKLSQMEAIITISEFSRREILNLLNIGPTKIHVTPLGVDRSFHPGRDQFERLPSHYILFLGNLEPRKNLSGLITAYQSLPQSLRRRYPLVIAGASGWHTHELKRALHLFQKNERPILMGYVPQGLLPRLYRGASLFVYPSLYEGFGLPVLEAMASGVPIITSDSTSLPEVVGDAGVLVNPYDVDHLKEAMLELLEDERKREEMAEKGIVRARLFSWEKCAHQTLSVYEKVMSKAVKYKRGDILV